MTTAPVDGTGREIRAVTTEGGKYRIPYSEIKKYLEKREETRAVIYARVSSADQRRLGKTNKLPNELRNGKGLQGS